MSATSSAAAAALAAACSGGGLAPQALSSLGSALASRAALGAATTNLIISPLSIYLALVLALNAAGVGSQTQAEILRALCAASQVGQTGYASLAPGGGLPAADAARAEAALNADASELARMLMMTTATASGGGAGSNNTKNSTAATAKAAAAEPPPPAAELLLANSLWTQQGPAGANVSAAYASRMASLLNAVAKKGDAAAVNAWASEATKGLVPQAVAPGTRFDLLLANAVYFKGQWEIAFAKSDTVEDANFSALAEAQTAAAAEARSAAGAAKGPSSTSSVAASSALAFRPKKVKMMQLRVKAAEDRAALRQGRRGPLIMITPRFIAARLPYRGQRQSAVLVLPRDASPGALRVLVAGSVGPGGAAAFDWRRDLALGQVPAPWAAAVANATGRGADELRRGGGGGGTGVVVPRPPVLPPPPRSASPADPADRLVPLPRAVPLGGGVSVGANGPSIMPSSSAQPTMPAGEQWLPPSARSSGGLELKMPKFRAETKQLRLKALLSDPQGLSVVAPFDPLAADFSRATEEKERLAIDDVIHSAVVVVDEEGTEAAAVTAVVMMRAMAPMVEEDPPVRVVLDRPFLFGVVDDATGTPMFTGAITDPEWREDQARA